MYLRPVEGSKKDLVAQIFTSWNRLTSWMHQIQDFKQAAYWYEKLAKQGDRRAQTSLGLMYARGYGVDKNVATARKWWSFAAAQNDPGAEYVLGGMFDAGEGVPRDRHSTRLEESASGRRCTPARSARLPPWCARRGWRRRL